MTRWCARIKRYTCSCILPFLLSSKRGGKSFTSRASTQNHDAEYGGKHVISHNQTERKPNYEKKRASFKWIHRTAQKRSEDTAQCPDMDRQTTKWMGLGSASEQRSSNV